MGIRVISGKLKGRHIPFNNKKFGNADITPQKVKGALFSILGETMTKKSLLDLYAGSGQIGIEALSRGADPVIMCEPDFMRYDFIRQYVEKIGYSGSALILNLTADMALSQLSRREIKTDFIFIDPPYNKENEIRAMETYRGIFTLLEKNAVLKKGGIVIIQHFSVFFFKEKVPDYILFDSRKYGSTALSFFKRE